MNDGAGDLLVLGKTGQGKSTWVQGYNAGLDRVLAWDPKRQYRNCEFREDLREFFLSQIPTTFRVGTVFPEYAEDR